MSALPIQSGRSGTTATRETVGETKARKDPDDRLISIAVAAAALGINEGHLRRKCAESDELRPYARRIGNAWHIDRAYDPRLAGADASLADAETRAGERLNAMPAEQRDRALTRALALQRFRRWRQTDGVSVTDHYEPHLRPAIRDELGLDPSLSSMYRWDDRAKGSTGTNAVALDLADARTSRRGTACSEPAWALFCEYYLDPRKWSVGKCHRAVAATAEREGWAWPGLRAIQRRVRDEIPAATKSLYREGRKAWDRDFKAPMEQDPDAYEAGQCWEGDHSKLDFFARVHRGGTWKPARLWLTAWMDRRTRCLVGWHVCESPSGESIKLALLKAIKDGWSLPEMVWIDNGKDYESAGMIGLSKAEKRAIRDAGESWTASARGHGLLGRLGIEPHYANPYNHNGKARIERMFGTLHMDHDREQPSWCGSKKDDVDPEALKRATDDVMSLPTLEDIRGTIAAWAEWYNHFAGHHVADLTDTATGEVLSRLEHYTRNLPSHRALADESVLLLLQREWSRPMSVSKHGVSLRLGGSAGGTLRYGATAPELEPFKGTDRKVFVTYDPEDVSRVAVFDGQYRYVCTAELNDRVGGVGKLSAEAMRSHFSARKQQRKRAREWRPAEAAARTPAEGAIAAQRRADIEATRARLAEQAGLPEIDAPPLRPVQTPLDGEHDELEAQEQRRPLAAGGEDVDVDDADDRLSVIDRLVASHRDAEADGAGQTETDESDGEAPPSYSILDAMAGARGEPDDAEDPPHDPPHDSTPEAPSLIDQLTAQRAREDTHTGGDEGPADRDATTRRDPRAPHHQPTITDDPGQPQRTEAAPPEKEAPDEPDR